MICNSKSYAKINGPIWKFSVVFFSLDSDVPSVLKTLNQPWNEGMSIKNSKKQRLVMFELVQAVTEKTWLNIIVSRN